jgi:hypothetical protein
VRCVACAGAVNPYGYRTGAPPAPRVRFSERAVPLMMQTLDAHGAWLLFLIQRRQGVLPERFNLMIVEFPGSELRSRGPQKAPRCLLCRMLPVGCSGELPWIPISAAEVLTYKINMNFHPPMRRNSCSRLDAVQGQERLKKAAFCDSVAAQKHENEDVVEKDPIPKGGSFQAY